MQGGALTGLTPLMVIDEANMPLCIIIRAIQDNITLLRDAKVTFGANVSNRARAGSYVDRYAFTLKDPPRVGSCGHFSPRVTSPWVLGRSRKLVGLQSPAACATLRSKLRELWPLPRPAPGPWTPGAAFAPVRGGGEPRRRCQALVSWLGMVRTQHLQLAATPPLSWPFQVVQRINCAN